MWEDGPSAPTWLFAALDGRRIMHGNMILIGHTGSLELL